MCGIFGTTKALPGMTFQRAVDRIAHRGPDTTGVYTSTAFRLALNRLAIIDPSTGSNQPIESDDRMTVVACNGAIYNYRELRKELEGLGCVFRTQGDIEVILHGYRQYGVQFFTRLRGMWAITLLDHRRGELILARDPLGIKPLYYTIEEGQVSVASEIRSLTAVAATCTPNTDAYYQLFTLGSFIDPDTQYAEITKVRPGTAVSIPLKEPRPRETDIMPEARETAEGGRMHTFAEAVPWLDEKLRESVAAHLTADVPVGLLLSGGTDSTLLAALTRALGYHPTAYTVDIAGSADTDYAREVSSELDMPHEVISFDTETVARQYARLDAILDEPTADSSLIPTMLVFQAVSGEHKAVLAGDGGDEWFGGYARTHALMHHARIGDRAFLMWLIDALQRRPIHTWTIEYLHPIIRRLRNLLLARGADDLVSAYLSETRILDYPIYSEELRQRLVALVKALPEWLRTPAPLALDKGMYLPNDILHKTDIASMAASVEARVPLTDATLARQLHGALAPDLMLPDNGVSKPLLKKVLSGYVSEGIVYRKKRGFSFSLERFAPQAFREDLTRALAFHQEHADAFGIKDDHTLFALTDPAYTEQLLRKYPQFAFALVTNYKIWQR